MGALCLCRAEAGLSRLRLVLWGFSQVVLTILPNGRLGTIVRAFFFFSPHLLRPLPVRPLVASKGKGKMAGLCESAVRTRELECALVRARACARSCI